MQTKYFPIIKVSDPKLRFIHVGLPIDTIVIRLQDLLTQGKFGFNNIFYDINKAGGIHNYLNFQGTIILSSVMKDQIISEFTAQKYIEALKVVKPDCWTSVDGETYEGEYITSISEIRRSYLETKEVMKACPEVTVIGQIKGCTRFMMMFHIMLLKRLGIKEFLFHTGDFSRRGKDRNRSKARDHACYIRDRVDKLYLYGTGSQKKLIEYSFADACISFNYFIKARNGQEYHGTNLSRYVGKYNAQIARKNLIEILKNTHRIRYQKKLFEGGVCTWAEVQEEIDQTIQEQHQLVTEVT